MIDILYFASLREHLGTAQEKLSIDQFQSVNCIIDALSQRGEQWNKALAENVNLQIAVNQNIADRSTEVKSGDEIAFFPPVTGG